ncbi:hypothetical protein N9A96_00210 [bacterium]|nr:hypothetical protein [bacterium]
MKSNETLMNNAARLSTETAEAKAALANLEGKGVDSLAKVTALQKAKVKLFDLEIKVAENFIELANAQKATAPNELADARFALDEAIAEVTDLLIEAGITANEMPSAGIEAGAAERQFLNGFVMTSSITRQAKAKVAEIEQFNRSSQQTLNRLNTNLETAKKNKALFFSKLVS